MRGRTVGKGMQVGMRERDCRKRDAGRNEGKRL